MRAAPDRFKGVAGCGVCGENALFGGNGRAGGGFGGAPRPFGVGDLRRGWTSALRQAQGAGMAWWAGWG